MKFKESVVGVIPEEWSIKKAQDYCIKVTDGTHDSPKKVNAGKYLITSRHIKNNSIDLENAYLISDEEFREVNKRSLVEINDILFSMIGTIGEAYYVKDSPSFAIKNIGLFKCGSDYDKGKWLYYYLKSKYAKNYIFKHLRGSTQQYMTLGSLREFPICYPGKKEEMIKINKILSDLDSKIELLQEQNKTLEAIGQAIFKHWFIDFEFPCLPENYKPVNNDEFSGACKLDEMKSVCTYKSVGGMPIPEKDKYFVYVLLCSDGSFYIGQTQDIYRRWYEHKTGKGAKWTKANEPIKVIHYEEYATRTDAAKREKELKTGFGRKWLKREYEKLIKSKKDLSVSKTTIEQAGSPAPKSKLRQAGKMVDSEMGMIPEGWNAGNYGDILEFERGIEPGSRNYLDKKEEDTVLFYRVGDLLSEDSKIYVKKDVIKDKVTTAKNVLVSFDGTVGRVKIGIEGSYSTGIRKVYSKDNAFTDGFIYFLMKTEFIQDKINKFAKGTTILHAGDAIKHFESVIPNNKIRSQFNLISESTFEKILANIIEIKSLQKIRDLLLPKLMSGQIRVPLENK